MTENGRKQCADVMQVIDNAGQGVVLTQHPRLICLAKTSMGLATGAVGLWVRSPVDTLRESRTECVGAGTLHNVDECSRVEEDLEKPSSARSI